MLSFLRERGNTRWSCARICAFLCCVAGIAVAIRTPSESGTVAALISGGTVALLSRSKQEPIQ